MPMIGRRFTPGMKRAAWGFMQSGDFPVPVGYWKFGENTGDEAKDSSPEGNDGDIHGASWVKGYLGSGLDFDGLDNWVDCGTDPSILPDAFTVIAAIKATELEVQPVIGWGDTITPSLCISLGLSRAIIYLGASNYRYFNHTPVNILDGAYHVVAFVVTGSEQDDIDDSKMYADGREQTVNGTRKTDVTKAKTLCHIGRATTYYYKGIADEVIMFDEALTAAQIRQWTYGIR